MSGKYTYIAPCHFGTEAVLKREIKDLGYHVTDTLDGRVYFEGDAAAAARAIIFLRTAERVMLCVCRFKAVTWDELFEKTKAFAWEEILPKNARFWVTKASTAKSTLFSSSDIQSIVKKAMVERMKDRYHISWFPEDGASYPVRVSIFKDIVTVSLDVSVLPRMK